MRKIVYILAFFIFNIYATNVTAAAIVASQASPAVPEVRSGTIERMPLFQSKFVEARNIDVWLPPGYNPEKRYSVLYMQDGQMLYDERTTWNKQAWHIDDAVTRLMANRQMQDTIVVGIWNISELRHSEYFPEKALALIAEPARSLFVEKSLHGKVLADRYLRFLVQELKPAIDQKYATLPDRDHTFVMGSSMGGLISIYALSEYPEIFGGAACLSTHWIGTFEANAVVPVAMFNYLQANLPDPAHHRIYMDRGTETLDALYAMAQPVVDQIVLDKGYRSDHFMSRIFPGAKHTESDWSSRLELPLKFIIGRSGTE